MAGKWRGGKERPLIDVELVFEVEDQTCRLASETARGGEGQMRGNEKVRDVSCVDFACDSSVIAGRASGFEDSATIWSVPDETEDGRVKCRGGGAKVVNGEMGLGDG